MNLNSPADRIVLSMWHRTRREFVEWTDEEIHRRASVISSERISATKHGLIRETYTDQNATTRKCYQITETGIERYQFLTSEESK